MSERRPAEFPRRVLVAASGLTPQVITETVYALAVQQEPRFVPTEVHLLTTREGAERARLSLLGRDPGWFRRLCREYGLKGVRFSENQVHVLRDGGGADLEDIRTAADNAAAADQAMSWIRTFTADGEAAVHVSLAGGRKTLGHFLGYALSLLGRPQDRLSHVLVAAPFESHPDFYYPTRERRIIFTAQPDSRPLDTSQASVTLAEIPFVRLRNWLPEEMRAGDAAFSDAVAAAQRRLGPPELTFCASDAAVEAGGVKIQLAPAEWAFYSWLARRLAAGEEAVSCPADGAPEIALARAYLREYRRVASDVFKDSRTEHALKRGMEKAFFLERKSRLHRALRSALGVDAESYLVRGDGKRPDTRYRLMVDPERIRWSE